MCRNWQLPFLNQRKGEHNCRKYFMIKSPQIVADLAGVAPATSWSPVQCASNWATEAGFALLSVSKKTFKFKFSRFSDTTSGSIIIVLVQILELRCLNIYGKYGKPPKGLHYWSWASTVSDNMGEFGVGDGGWVISCIWHSMDVRAEWPPFSALPSIWLAPFFSAKSIWLAPFFWISIWKAQLFWCIPVHAHIFHSEIFRGYLSSWYSMNRLLYFSIYQQ